VIPGFERREQHVRFVQRDIAESVFILTYETAYAYLAALYTAVHLERLMLAIISVYY
jgi:hypothetical protein